MLWGGGGDGEKIESVQILFIFKLTVSKSWKYGRRISLRNLTSDFRRAMISSNFASSLGDFNEFRGYIQQLITMCTVRMYYCIIF